MEFKKSAVIETPAETSLPKVEAFLIKAILDEETALPEEDTTLPIVAALGIKDVLEEETLAMLCAKSCCDGTSSPKLSITAFIIFVAFDVFLTSSSFHVSSTSSKKASTLES